MIKRRDKEKAKDILITYLVNNQIIDKEKSYLENKDFLESLDKQYSLAYRDVYIFYKNLIERPLKFYDSDNEYFQLSEEEKNKEIFRIIELNVTKEQIEADIENIFEPQYKELVCNRIFSHTINRDVFLNNMSGGNKKTRKLYEIAYTELRDSPPFIIKEYSDNKYSIRIPKYGNIPTHNIPTPDQYKNNFCLSNSYFINDPPSFEKDFMKERRDKFLFIVSIFGGLCILGGLILGYLNYFLPK